MSPPPPVEYPIQLALAFLLLFGYLLRTIFIAARLPGAVGVIVSGFCFSFFIQQDIFEGRDHLQALSFFLVLLTAGFEIKIDSLNVSTLVFGMLPATLELITLVIYAVNFMGYTLIEACVLGCAIFCVGDGLVIPKMGEFGEQFRGHYLPRRVFAWAPLEASYALTLFGILGGLADPAHQHTPGMGILVFSNLLRIVLTVTVGGILGAAAGKVIPRRTEVEIFGKPIFSGKVVEAYLMVLATALIGFGMGSTEGRIPAPMVFAPGSLFQPELMVIVIGSSFGHFVKHSALHEIEGAMASVWVFGQIILFSMLGSKTDVSIFSHVREVLPLMAVGLPVRFVGWFIATYGTLRVRPCTCKACMHANLKSAPYDALFCFLSSLPRATIQGALGAIALTNRFFSHEGARHEIQLFIAVAAKTYIVICAVVGSLLLDYFGNKLLQTTADRYGEGECTGPGSGRVGELYAPEGWKGHSSSVTSTPKSKNRPVRGRRNSLHEHFEAHRVERRSVHDTFEARGFSVDETEEPQSSFHFCAACGKGYAGEPGSGDESTSEQDSSEEGSSLDIWAETATRGHGPTKESSEEGSSLDIWAETAPRGSRSVTRGPRPL